MNRFLIVVLLLTGVASAVSAQTISPLVTEYKNKANGNFQLQNNTLKPLIVTVTPLQFSLDKEGQHFRPLDPATHIDLSETSARLSPLEIHTFSYKIRCDVLPCNIGFLSDMAMGKTKEGIQVKIILEAPAVYICAKTAKDCRRNAWALAGRELPQTAAK